MRKTTITVRDTHAASYAAFRRERPSLTLSDFYAEAVDFRLRHGDDASLRPTLRAQQALLQRLDGVMQGLSQPMVDYHRLERHAKQVGDHVAGSIDHLARGVQASITRGVALSQQALWRLGVGMFAMGVLTGGAIVGLSWILW